MNYEALGRYTEAKEKAEKLAISLHNEMAGISRLVSPSGTSKLGQAKAYDFEAIKRQVASAELIYGEMMATIAAANHEAPLCEREVLTVAKW